MCSTRPWSGIESRSAESELEKLKKWHGFLGGDFVAGQFTIVQPCTATPGQWQVGVGLDWIQGKEVREPLIAYCLVEQLGQYRFRMGGISFNRQQGCPGESPPSDESPSLFPSASR
jgi:hypothetical protein